MLDPIRLQQQQGNTADADGQADLLHAHWIDTTICCQLLGGVLFSSRVARCRARDGFSKLFSGRLLVISAWVFQARNSILI